MTKMNESNPISSVKLLISTEHDGIEKLIMCEGQKKIVPIMSIDGERDDEIEQYAKNLVKHYNMKVTMVEFSDRKNLKQFGVH